MSQQEPIGLDNFPVTQDEAVELFVHHLKLACVFFMNTPDDKGEQIKEEIARQFTLKRYGGFYEETGAAAETFTDAMTKIYEEDKKREISNDPNR